LLIILQGGLKMGGFKDKDLMQDTCGKTKA
jgi:hypothetical protein